jgi:hypothetical protein
MLLSILLAIVICGTLVFAGFLLAPLKLSLSGTFTESARHFTSYLSWLHPAVLRCDIDGGKRSFSIIVLGRFRLFSSEDDETPGPVPPGTGTRNGARLRPEEQTVVEKPRVPDEYQKSFEHDSNTQRAAAGGQKTAHAAGPSASGKSTAPGKGSAKEKKKVFGFIRSKPAKRALVIFRAASWRRKIFRWLIASIARFFHLVSVSRFRVHIRLGLDDPGRTGIAYGCYIAAKTALADNGNSRKEISFEPVFNAEIAEADGAIEISSSLARLCLPLFLAVATFPFLHTVMVYLRVKRIKAGT